MTDSYELEQRTAIVAVGEAAGLCRTVQQQISPDVLEKKDRSPVTIADFGSQALVCRTLEQAFPDDPVIGEEDAASLREADNASLLAKVVDQVGRVIGPVEADDVCRWIDRGNAMDYSQRFWTLDPIDGTKGFLRGGQYAIAVAMVVDGEVAVAALGCPNLAIEPTMEPGDGVIVSAVRGQGVWMSPMNAPDERRPIHVSANNDPSTIRFCESVESGHSSHGHSAQVAELLGITAEPVRLDSQAKYAIVARGQAEVYLRLPTRADYVEKIWDHAAGVLVVEEAGGRISDVAGKPIEFNHGHKLTQNRGIVVTHGPIHDALIDALQKVGVA